MRAMTVERSPRGFELPPIDALSVSPRTLWLASLAALLLALAVLAGQWRDPPVSRLQLQGPFEHVQPEAVRAAVLPALGQGFFAVDVEDVQARLTAMPWVARARVERAWPMGLTIRLWERTPYARWNSEGLLDTDSRAFTPLAIDRPPELLQGLPQLAGTPGTEQRVAQTYRVLAAALADTPLALNGLALDARGEWTAQTRIGIALRLGSGEAADKLPTITGALLAAVGTRLEEVAYVDLRYTNGFAIGWVNRPGTPAAAGARAADRPLVPPMDRGTPTKVDGKGNQHG